MIERYLHRDREYRFLDMESLRRRRNAYTILVGKNGTGKSTLLSSIVRDLLTEVQSESMFRASELGFRHSRRGEVILNSQIDQIIAVSTSPFDKFPILRPHNHVDGYSYLGLRGLHSLNFGVAYLSSIIAGLVESIRKDHRQFEGISRVLNYLGYQEFMRIKFSLSSSRKLLSEFLEIEDPMLIFDRSNFRLFRNFNRRYFLLENGEIDLEKLWYLREVSRRIIDQEFRSNIELVLHGNGIDSEYGYDEFIREDLEFLIQSGLIRLRDVGLEALDGSGTFSIREASSGEQSVMLSILGISSKIRNNSLVCIDEPEVCLHPKWQEKYMQMLIQTFDSYENCHFIIATHSPQIISRLNTENCFILSMESDELRDANRYINHSADFQLANIFDSPGYKNEYLSRIALNIFTKVSRRKMFDEEDLDKLNILREQSQYLEESDPVYNLYLSIEKLLGIYG